VTLRSKDCGKSFVIAALARTFLIAGTAGFCTCGLDGGNVFKSVTESVNYFLSYENLVANRAVRAFCKTCFCASRSNCLVNNGSVTESVDYFLLNLCITSGAVCAFSETCFCTGRSLAFKCHNVVTERLTVRCATNLAESLLCASSLTAYVVEERAICVTANVTDSLVAAVSFAACVVFCSGDNSSVSNLSSAILTVCIACVTVITASFLEVIFNVGFADVVFCIERTVGLTADGTYSLIFTGCCAAGVGGFIEYCATTASVVVVGAVGFPFAICIYVIAGSGNNFTLFQQYVAV
jgi:hypothetical protein